MCALDVFVVYVFCSGWFSLKLFGRWDEESRGGSLFHLMFSYAAGSINISNILTGKCLAKINATNASTTVEECSSSSTGNSGKCIITASMMSTVSEALDDITALFYDEERNEIYTGNRHGLVHVWSN
ncbi:hypothetical protein HS088_TW13G00199 [Tripterygium wilfordii]|uniref:Uncharacterized protein n=1 Tax=Tripterygium wilfordii TaxID=458696 RepID=A0A7J7CTA6_TRIWF|nr:hypothetical protein HS088_TW13G00199 [Tripterygium wilfordii]